MNRPALLALTLITGAVCALPARAQGEPYAAQGQHPAAPMAESYSHRGSVPQAAAHDTGTSRDWSGLPAHGAPGTGAEDRREIAYERMHDDRRGRGLERGYY
jgi:hypothetical protein